MKKVTLLTCLLMLLTTSWAWSQAHVSENTQVGIGTELPGFSFTSIDGAQITPDALPANQPVIVFYFDAFCDHCQQEAQWVNENPQLFKGITLLWVSWSEIEEIREFKNKYLPNVKNDLYMTKDVQFQFDNYFGYSEIPSIYVYNKLWKRSASFKAETKPEILVKFARQ